MNRSVLLMFLCLPMVFSCETVIDIDVDEEDPRLVINGFFNPDSTFRINIRESLFILDRGRSEPVAGASVSITDGEGNVVDLPADTEQGIYVGEVTPEPGKSYRLEVSKEGFETVAAIDGIPAEPVNLTGYEALPGEAGEIEFSLGIDDGEGSDFYEFYFVKKLFIPVDGETHVMESVMFINSDDPVLQDFDINQHIVYFDDTLFDGSEVSLEMRISAGCCFGDGEEEITLYLRKVSESYYRYKKSVLLQSEAGGNPFAEPVTVFTNVENGFGIFGGFRVTRHLITLSSTSQPGK